MNILKIKKTRLFSLILLMFLAVLTITMPKSYAIDSGNFAGFDSEEHKANVVDVNSTLITLDIFEGPAGLHGSGSDGITGTFKFSSTSEYFEDDFSTFNVGDVLDYIPGNQTYGKWKKNVPVFDDFNNVNLVGTVISIHTEDGSGFEKAVVYIESGIYLSFEFYIDTEDGTVPFDYVLPHGIKVNDTVIWDSDTGTWNTDYAPIFSGETAFVSNIDDLITLDKVLSRIKVFDNEDGDITHKIKFLFEDRGIVDWGNMQDYEQYAENLNANNHDEVLSYLENLTVEYGHSGLGQHLYIYSNPVGPTFVPFLNGNITIMNSDGYTYPSKLGTHILPLYVRDSNDNISFLTVYVHVVDVDVPVISGKNVYDQSYTKKLDINTVIDNLTVVDNYDEDMYLDIRIDEDNYSSEFNKIGAYTLEVSSEDSSGNIGTYTITINVVDDVAPVFTAPNNIVKGAKQTLLLDDILADVKVNDAVDGNLSFTVIADSYTGKGHIQGTYNLVLQAEDSSGNIATHTIEIQVLDDIPPIFYVDNFFINVDDVIHLTRNEIINLLVATGQLQVNATTTFSFPLDEYQGNEDVPGVYGMMVKSTSPDGTSRQVSLAIKVNETETEEDVIIQEPDKGFFEKVWDFIQSSWEWLKSPINEESSFRNGYYILIGIGAVGLLSTLGLVGSSRKYKSRRRKYRR